MALGRDSPDVQAVAPGVRSSVLERWPALPLCPPATTRTWVVSISIKTTYIVIPLVYVIPTAMVPSCSGQVRQVTNISLGKRCQKY
jgi:hypothetical protein